MGTVAQKELEIESLLSMAMNLAEIWREEEERLKEEFPDVKIIRTGGVPPKLTVVYDFLKLDKDRRYKLFEFEKRLLGRLESAIKEHLGEEPPFPPVLVEFVRKA